MLWETPLIQTMLDSPSHPSDCETQVLKQGRVSTAPRRRRAVSTSLPLKTLCTFNPDHYSPSITNLYSNLDSIFHCLPATPRLFGFEEPLQQPPKSFVPPKPQSQVLPCPTPSPSSRGAPPTNGGVINTLPPELLCLIFESYLEPSSSSTDDSGVPPEVDPYTHTSSPHGFFSVSREYIRTPIPLTHVCQSWRHAAIGHRRLWSSIAFALANGRDEDDEEEEEEEYADDGSQEFEVFARGKIQLLRLFLRRARDTPLSISFNASVTTPTSSWSFNRDFGLVHEALKLICRYSRTWKDLRVELDQGWAVEMFSELLVRSPAAARGGFERLQSLHLELAVDDGEEDLGRILATPGLGHTATQMLALRAMHSQLKVKDIYRVLVRRSPNLTDITLDDTFFLCVEGSEYDACPSYRSRCPWDDDVHPDDDFVPWTQLKTLTIQSDSISTRKVLDVCSRASNLETLKVWRVGSNGSSEVDCDFEAGPDFRPSSIPLQHLRSLDVTLLSEPDQLFAPLALGPQLESVKVNVYALQSRAHLGGYGSQRRSSLKEILEPVDRMLAAASSSSSHCTVDVHCSIKESCVNLDGSEPDEQWMEENGLSALVRCGGRRVVEVYKY